MNNLNCGVYKILNLVNGKCYVGKSKNIKSRWATHKSKLRNNKHPNAHLQSAFNLYGIENFEFSILIYCEPFELGYYEGQFKKYLHAEYNIDDIDEESGERIISEETKMKMSDGHWDCSGESNPFYGKTHTDETKQKMSDNHWNNSGENHPLYGKHHSEETKQFMKENYSGKNSPNFGIKSDKASSKFFGVRSSWVDGKLYWRTEIKINKKNVYIGTSKTELEAAIKYNNYVIANGLPNPLNVFEQVPGI